MENGDLWILFINHFIDVVNKLSSTFIVSGIIIVTGTALMGIIAFAAAVVAIET